MPYFCFDFDFIRGSLYPRIQQCMLNNGGFKPNFIALDWVTQSTEAKEILDYLNFGGKLGTGQTCTEDSHCATSSCSPALGVCQCQQCPSDRVNVCLGCVSGQYCAPPGGEGMNTCKSTSQTQNQIDANADTGADTGAETVANGEITTVTTRLCNLAKVGIAFYSLLCLSC